MRRSEATRNAAFIRQRSTLEEFVRPLPSYASPLTCNFPSSRRNSPMHWQKITLVGVGLLGGSLGQAIRRRRLARRVVGYVRREASVVECQKLGAVDEAE